ncbi:MAG: RNA polymerase sigma factor [Candidatus Delongbacteria bacterium]
MPENSEPRAPSTVQLAGRVYRYLRSLVGDADAARDLTQDLLLKLHDQPGAGLALVFTVARNLGLSHLRHRTVRQRVVMALGENQDLAETALAPEAEWPDRRLEAKDLRADLRAALAGLSEEQRTVFHLTEIEGLRYLEVAAVLGISVGTVASRKHHAVRRLQIELRRRGHGA